MVTLASADSRYTTSQGSYKQLTLHSAISRKMETMRISPVRYLQSVGGWWNSGSVEAWDVSEGGEPNSFQSKVAAHAIADMASNVAMAPKRVR